MDPFIIVAVIALAASALLGVACMLSVKGGVYGWPFGALFVAPAFVLIVEIAAFPSNLDGVTSLTGVMTMMYCVLWVPYWMAAILAGFFLGAKASP